MNNNDPWDGLEDGLRGPARVAELVRTFDAILRALGGATPEDETPRTESADDSSEI